MALNSEHNDEHVVQSYTSYTSHTSHTSHTGYAGRRLTVVIVSVAFTLAACVGYMAADLCDVVPGLLTLRSASVRTYPDAASSIAAGTIAGEVNRNVSVDAAKAEELINRLVQAEGMGADISVAIADANGAIAAQRDADIEREPASTVKTLTAFAAASTLDMSGTLDTETYLTHADTNPTLVLKGHGDMLLGAGESDPNHINGRAGLATLAQSTAKALKKQGITHVALAVDDTLFGDDRTPAGIEENNDDNRYYTPISSMAVDGGRDWSGLDRGSQDAFTEYPVLSQNTAADTAAIFKTLLAAQDIEVGSSDDISGTDTAELIAKVSSAPLNEVLAFMLRQSDNTLAQLFARLTALELGTGNSTAADVQAVEQVLSEHGVPIEGLVLTSCSGLATGTRLRMGTLLGVQQQLVSLEGGAAAASEGMSVPGLTGTAKNRVASQSVRGLARLKTGSLSGVCALTGNVSREQGGVLLFAVIVNNPTDSAAAVNAIDQFVAQLAQL